MEQRRRPFSIAEIKEKTPIQGASLMVQPIAEGEFNQSSRAYYAACQTLNQLFSLSTRIILWITTVVSCQHDHPVEKAGSHYELRASLEIPVNSRVMAVRCECHDGLLLSFDLQLESLRKHSCSCCALFKRLGTYFFVAAITIEKTK
ncbi:hypothetical protein OUZ56_001158 [Daphnia magna]|uniref:Uncharacterized protein n=1 Tax=Daphnia magna TaxID=35525 RepID=A0ABR0A1T7_9CRUS|nr:hypothetical protein OUZ56_001158 [Daphnia magna]